MSTGWLSFAVALSVLVTPVASLALVTLFDHLDRRFHDGIRRAD